MADIAIGFTIIENDQFRSTILILQRKLKLEFYEWSDLLGSAHSVLVALQSFINLLSFFPHIYLLDIALSITFLSVAVLLKIGKLIGK